MDWDTVSGYCSISHPDQGVFCSQPVSPTYDYSAPSLAETRDPHKSAL